MGRYYKTSRPRFVDDNIYKAPWELMQNVIMQHEQRTDNLLSQTELLDGAVDNIQHLNYDSENERVKAIQDKYRNSIEELTNTIYSNPLEYKKHLPQIKKMQREMIKDKTSGDWYNIEQRYKDYQGWLKDNEKMRETNPTLFNQLNNHWYNDLVNKSSADPKARFSGQKIIDRPDLSNDKTRKIFENIKANYNEYLTPDGNYKIGDKVLTEEEVAQIAMAELFSDPSYAGYVNQMGNILGQKGYFDDEGNSLGLFTEDEEGRSRLNFDHAFANDILSVAKTYGFSEHTIDADKFGLQRNKAKLDSQLNAQKHAHRMGEIGARGNVQMQLELLRQQGRKDLLIKKYELQGEKDKVDFKNNLTIKAAGGDKEAIKLLNQITAKETIGVIGNPNATLDGDYSLINSNREKAPTAKDGETIIYARPGTTEYAAQQRRANATNYATNKLKKSTITLNDGKSFNASEYFEWLGERKHDEETAREFLEREKGIYVKTDFNQVGFPENILNQTRWTPSWTKEDAAKDWDKVYELGENYEKYRNEWYKNYSTSSQQVSLQPIVNTEVATAMVNEIKTNTENFYLTDENGETPKKMRELLNKVDANSNLSVTAANAHNEMGMQVTIDGKEYYVFPNNGNAAASNLMTNLSMRGVDPTSQYFKEMSNRTSSDLLHNLSKSGQNSKGTKSIVTKLDGVEVSLELVGNEVHLREPNQGLNTDPVRVFQNMSNFVDFFYSSQTK